MAALAETVPSFGFQGTVRFPPAPVYFTITAAALVGITVGGSIAEQERPVGFRIDGLKRPHETIATVDH
ncbi:MAG: hypothetical protein DWH79_00525 [Planctomycetota bacterium]|nr:MAG: hypothetical protein DWH79_00525 [Planctomycetota bacterium]